MNIDDEQQNVFIHDKRFLNDITMICLIVSLFYMGFYFFLDLTIPGYFNIAAVLTYSMYFLLSRFKLKALTPYWTVSIYIIQIFVFSFVFFPQDTGYNIYFLVAPFIIIFISKHKYSFIKILYMTIPVLLYFYSKIFSSRLSPLYELSADITRILYLSAIFIVILGMALVIYFFNKEKQKLINEIINAKTYAESLFNLSPCAIYTIDLNNKIINFNNKAESISGYNHSELKNRKVDFISGDILRTKTGSQREIEKYSSELYDLKNEHIGYIISFFDITKRVELEDFKRGIERVIRHDLKTPLNSILGFPKLLLEDESVSDENKEYLKIIINSGNNMLNLINSTQDLYKIEHGAYIVKPEKTDVLAVLRLITTALDELKNRKRCYIEILYNDEIAEKDLELNIQTEKTLFYMILMNLIKNALEASPINEKITVRIQDKIDFVISIHNNGVIPAEIRSTFFNKYITFGKKDGNGLGTYSAKIMSEAIGAILDFTCDEEMGTVLTFRL